MIMFFGNNEIIYVGIEKSNNGEDNDNSNNSDMRITSMIIAIIIYIVTHFN